jgi:NTP pyrophosphatase (non-canonical NTP hydrolase)
MVPVVTTPQPAAGDLEREVRAALAKALANDGFLLSTQEATDAAVPVVVRLIEAHRAPQATEHWEPEVRAARLRAETAERKAAEFMAHADHQTARAETAEAAIEGVREWAMVNEIAPVPLDWKGLGEILAALDGTEETRPADSWQDRIGAWVDATFPGDDLTRRGLILGEETGEVQRSILKAAQDVRGGSAKWMAELPSEVADVFICLAAIAHRAGFDLDAAIEARWAELSGRTYPTGATR